MVAMQQQASATAMHCQQLRIMHGAVPDDLIVIPVMSKEGLPGTELDLANEELPHLHSSKQTSQSKESATYT